MAGEGGKGQNDVILAEIKGSCTMIVIVIQLEIDVYEN